MKRGPSYRVPHAMQRRSLVMSFSRAWKNWLPFRESKIVATHPSYTKI